MKGKTDLYKKPEKAGFETLAEAVVLQAVADYRDAKRRIREAEESEKDSLVAKIPLHNKTINEISRFFRSGWGGALCFGNGEFILRRLEAEGQ